jgi:hypothetical protein
MFINPKYNLRRKEEVTVYNSEGEVFNGKVKLPRKAAELCKELDSKRYIENPTL